MWDIFRKWVLRADLRYAGVRSLASFGECVVTRVEVLALLLAGLVADRREEGPACLQFVLEKISLVWQFAV